MISFSTKNRFKLNDQHFFYCIDEKNDRDWGRIMMTLVLMAISAKTNHNAHSNLLTFKCIRRKCWIRRKMQWILSFCGHLKCFTAALEWMRFSCCCQSPQSTVWHEKWKFYRETNYRVICDRNHNMNWAVSGVAWCWWQWFCLFTLLVLELSRNIIQIPTKLNDIDIHNTSCERSNSPKIVSLF